jgi:hypothetical protein
MSKKVQNVRPGQANDFTWQDLYDEISTDWEGKAARLQARRRRKALMDE